MVMTLYREISYGKAFVHQCEILEFRPGMAKIRYTKGPAIPRTTIIKWVCDIDISVNNI